MRISVPFTKAHGAQNDFLLTWESAGQLENLPGVARRICHRYMGVGADGWILIAAAPSGDSSYDAAIRLFNSDGSTAEISGNGTRCAAAFLIDKHVTREEVRILTGAGIKHLRLLAREGRSFSLEMNMGNPRTTQSRLETHDVTLVDAGNPQCAIQVESFEFDWHKLGSEIEAHPRFPNRTNVSFYRVIDPHTIEARFFERGAGATMSSGTGATGAAAAAVSRGRVESPVRVLTLAGPLDLRWNNDVFLAGPADIVASGEYYL